MVAKAQVSSHPPLYRVWQFVQALTARPLAPAEWSEVAPILTPSQGALFRKMDANDQRHSLQVMRALIDEGETNRDLLAAALLHDVGKSCYPLRLWERPVVVLIRLFRPFTAVRWGNGEPVGWKRPFVIYEQHPTWGAEMAAAAGCSSLTVWLIRHHQDRHDTTQKETELLQTLQKADNAN